MRKIFLIYSIMSLCVMNTPLNAFADETMNFPGGQDFPTTDEENNQQLLNPGDNTFGSENSNGEETEDSGSSASVDEDDPMGDMAVGFDELEEKLNNANDVERVDDGFTDEEKEEYDKKLTKIFPLDDNAKRIIFNKVQGSLELDPMLASTVDTSNYNVGDLVLTIEPHIEHYVWNVWYRQTKEEMIDTTIDEGRGNYTGFSKEKAAAWNEHQTEIKSINAGAYPEVKDYTYSPGYTLNNKLDFWADKPGYYDVYGDPIYTQIDITAKVKIDYQEKWEDVQAKAADKAREAMANGYKSGGGKSGGGGPAGSGADMPDVIKKLFEAIMNRGKEDEEKDDGIPRTATCRIYSAPNGATHIPICDDSKESREQEKRLQSQGYIQAGTMIGREDLDVAKGKKGYEIEEGLAYMEANKLIAQMKEEEEAAKNQLSTEEDFENSYLHQLYPDMSYEEYYNGEYDDLSGPEGTYFENYGVSPKEHIENVAALQEKLDSLVPTNVSKKKKSKTKYGDLVASDIQFGPDDETNKTDEVDQAYADAWEAIVNGEISDPTLIAYALPEIEGYLAESGRSIEDLQGSVEPEHQPTEEEQWLLENHPEDYYALYPDERPEEEDDVQNDESTIDIVAEGDYTRYKDRHQNVTLAAITLRNITGSQLERIGSFGLTSTPDHIFYLDDDEFWEEDPYYYYTTGGYLEFEDMPQDVYTALPFGFGQDADELGVKLKFTDKTIYEKALVHAYNKLEDSLTGKDIMIDASLDVNNKDSQYVGKVPLVNFKINDETASQKEQKNGKKNVFLTSESEKDAEDEKKKQREEEENKESYIAQ